MSASEIRRPWVTLLVVVCAAQFVLQLDFSIVNVALPTIQRNLGFAAIELQWIVTGYALTFGALLLLGGRLGDLLGRRRLLALGLGVFAVASLTSGLAVSAPMLIGSRLVQGAAAAMVSPSAFALLASSNPEGPARNRALGLFAASTAAGASAGVVAGGILVDLWGWRAIFLVNVPIVAVLLLLVRQVVPADAARGHPRLDLVGAALVTGAGAALIYGCTAGEAYGFTAPIAVGTLAAAVAMAVIFVGVERRVAAPMISFSYLRSPTHRAALGTMALLGGVVAAYVYFASLYLQRVLGVSPLWTGLALLPSTLTVVLLSSLVTRRLLARWGVKWVLLAGIGLVGVGQLWMASVSATGTYWANVLPGMIITSCGLSLAFPTAAVAASSGVEKGDQGVAGGQLTTAQQMGAAVGLAVLATIAATRTNATGSLSAGYATSFLVAVGFTILAAVWVLSRLNHAVCQAELARLEGRPPTRPGLLRTG